MFRAWKDFPVAKLITYLFQTNNRGVNNTTCFSIIRQSDVLNVLGGPVCPRHFLLKYNWIILTYFVLGQVRYDWTLMQRF